jgi:hypothetical protein
MLLLSNIPGQASGCIDLLGRHVILASDAIDPHVFVWDRRSLMVSYAAGFWLPTRLIFDHTLLEKPGTRGYIVSCRPHELHVRYTPASRDAVGVRLSSGPDRGRYGWANEEDVHPTRSR